MYAMLSLNFDSNTTQEQTDIFNEYLATENWTKVPKVPTTWYVRFKDDSEEEAVVNSVKLDVEKAADYAGINAWDAIVNVSSNEPVKF